MRGYGELALALLVYGSIALYQLDLPGLHYDEAMEVLPALQILRGLPGEPFRGVALNWAGRSFPLMIVDYIGALNTYLSLPAFWLGGIHVYSLRALAVVWGGLTLLAAYLATRMLFDRTAATLAAFLLAVNPSFIFWTRQGVFVTSIIALLSTASLLCFIYAWRAQRRWPWYLGAALLGLGLYAKLSTLWFVAGLLVAAALVRLPSLRRGTRAGPRPVGWLRARAPLALGVGGFFLLGASPLIGYNLRSAGTLAVILDNLSTSYYGVNNLAFAENLRLRLEHLRVLLNGGHLWYLGGIQTNDLYPPIFVLAILSGLLLVFVRQRQWGAPFLFTALLLATMIPLSAFTVSALWVTHYMILLPWPQVLLAASLALGIRHARQRSQPLLLAPFLLAAAALLGGDLRVDLAYHRALSRTGGFPYHSAAIYDLAAYLEGSPAVRKVAMDWGIRSAVYFLSQGRVDAQEIFGYESFSEPDPGFRERLLPYVNDPSTLYVFHSPAWTVFQRQEAFRSIVQALGKETRLERLLYDRSGMEVYQIWRVLPA